MSPNLIAFPIAMLGIIRTGAAQVNVNPLYTARELEYQLNDAGVNIIIVYSGVSATVAEVLAKTKLKTVIAVSPGDGTTAKLPGPAVDPRLTGAIAFADTLSEGATLPFSPVDVGPDAALEAVSSGDAGSSRDAAPTGPGSSSRADCTDAASALYSSARLGHR